MKPVVAHLAALTALLFAPAWAQESTEGAAELVPLNAAEVTIEDFLWTKRAIIVMAATDADPRFQEQMELLLARPGELLERDVVIIVDTDPSADSALRTRLRPRQFQLAVIGKDGEIKLRKPFPWSVREITRAIDKMPLRQQEIRENGS